MEIKYTTQGLLIYAAMGAYVLGFVGLLVYGADHRAGRAGMKRLAMALYAVGFAISSASFVYRCHHVGRVPLKNLFEVFLFLGMLMFPLSMFCRFVLRVGGETWDMLIAAAVLFPAGFVFDMESGKLMPALQSWLFAPHVATYMVAYAVMAKATAQAIEQLANGDRAAEPGLVRPEIATYKMIGLGFPVLTIGLILGAVWGKLAWGDYWHWDPKELWSLVSWLVYLAYFHFRATYGRRYVRINAALAIAGMAAIAITLLWANLSRLFSGMHSYAT